MRSLQNYFNSDRTDEMMYFVLDYFAGQTGVRNGSTGNILDLLGRGYEAPVTHDTHAHTHMYIHKEISKRGLL